VGGRVGRLSGVCDGVGHGAAESGCGWWKKGEKRDTDMEMGGS
jgi:hypothetical protein